MALNTPYASLVPPLSDDALRSLRSALATGQHSPVLIDEHDNILDGHNRHALLGDGVQTQTVYGLTEAEKKAFVVTSAVARRNLTPDQRSSLRETMKQIARDLRAEDPKKHTQESIAMAFGVGRSTVEGWLNTNDDSGIRVEDARKLPESKRVEAVERVRAGERQADIADDLGVSKAVVSKWRADAGIKPSRAPSRPRPEMVERQKQVLELHNEGMGTAEIGRKLGIDPNQVSHAKIKLGIAETSPGVKLWSDVDHLATVFEGTELKAAELAARLERAEFTADRKEIERCIKSLSRSKRTVARLISALKQRLR